MTRILHRRISICYDCPLVDYDEENDLYYCGEAWNEDILSLGECVLSLEKEPPSWCPLPEL